MVEETAASFPENLRLSAIRHTAVDLLLQLNDRRVSSHLPPMSCICTTNEITNDGARLHQGCDSGAFLCFNTALRPQRQYGPLRTGAQVHLLFHTAPEL